MLAGFQRVFSCYKYSNSSLGVGELCRGLEILILLPIPGIQCLRFFIQLLIWEVLNESYSIFNLCSCSHHRINRIISCFCRHGFIKALQFRVLILLLCLLKLKKVVPRRTRNAWRRLKAKIKNWPSAQRKWINVKQKRWRKWRRTNKLHQNFILNFKKPGLSLNRHRTIWGTRARLIFFVGHRESLHFGHFR